MRKPAKERRVAIVLSNYPNRESRIGNAVGLDTAASAIRIAEAMKLAGYSTSGFPRDSEALIASLTVGAPVDTPLPSPRPPIAVGGKLQPGSIAGHSKQADTLSMDAGFAGMTKRGVKTSAPFSHSSRT